MTTSARGSGRTRLAWFGTLRLGDFPGRERAEMIRRRQALERRLDTAAREVDAARRSLATALNNPRAAAGEVHLRRLYLDRTERVLRRCHEASAALSEAGPSRSR